MDGEEEKFEGLLSRFAEDVKKEFSHQLGIQREEFSHQLGVQREEFQKQMAVTGEGYQMLSEKIDRVETGLNKRMDCLEWKLDAIASDLAAHRADTEAHPPVYRVKE